MTAEQNKKLVRRLVEEAVNPGNPDVVAEVARDGPARSAVLLNRCVARAHSTAHAREAFQDLGYDVLQTAVPRLEVYAQSFGLTIPGTGRDAWRCVARELIERHARLRPVASSSRRQATR